MAAFFPQVTGTFQRHEYPVLRRLSMSVVAMAAVTGLLVRLFRALTLSFAPNERLLFLAIAFGAGLLLLFTAVTLHLGNFTLKHWIWRAPAFAAIEAAVESVTSALLIAANREPLGSTRASFADWPGMSLDTFLWRIVAVVAYALVLAGVVQAVRTLLTRKERRERALEAGRDRVVSRPFDGPDDKW